MRAATAVVDIVECLRMILVFRLSDDRHRRKSYEIIIKIECSDSEVGGGGGTATAMAMAMQIWSVLPSHPPRHIVLPIFSSFLHVFEYLIITCG